MSKITLTVFKMGAEYGSSRTFGDDDPLHPGTLVFKITKELKDGENLDGLHNEAKAEARKRGIKKVINLDSN